MKTIYNCWIVLSVLLLATSCNDEWTEEQYKQYISHKRSGCHEHLCAV